MIENPPPGEEWTAFVAEEAGEIVGWVSAFHNIRAVDEGVGVISLLHVAPNHRNRGIGDRLYAAAKDHLLARGIRRATAMASEDGLGFARRRGFEVTGEIRYSSLDLTDFDQPAPEPPEGLRIVSLREVAEHALYVADTLATADEPTAVPSEPLSLESWRYEIWNSVSLDRDASAAAITADGEVVSFSLVARDGDRVWSDMTGTLPAYRGRGLARTVKIVALRRSGARVAYTSNDETNLPMLAVNTRLGYRPAATQFTCENKDVAHTSGSTPGDSGTSA